MDRPAFERRLTPCAEFPNDNPDLHRGAVWPRFEPTRDLASDPLDDDAPPVEIVDDLDSNGLVDEAEPIDIVDELSFDQRPDGALAEGAADSEASFGEPPPVDPFAQLVAAIGEVARALGARADGIACLDALFGQTRLEGFAAGDRADALLAGGVLTLGARGFARSGNFTATVLAWQGILRGETEDFSMPDGGALEPLDEWTADVLARVLGPPARADGIRRDLRRRGIAAFGLVSQAA